MYRQRYIDGYTERQTRIYRQRYIDGYTERQTRIYMVMSYASSLIFQNKEIRLKRPVYMWISHRCMNNRSMVNLYSSSYIVTWKGLAWLIIMSSRFDDWIYWHFFTIITAHALNSFCTTSLWRISLRNLSLLSPTPFISLLFFSRIHESTAFYNGHAAGIEVTISSSSCYSALLLLRNVCQVSWQRFDSCKRIRCCGNRCQPTVA
jgi:hypothetical protein